MIVATPSPVAKSSPMNAGAPDDRARRRCRAHDAPPSARPTSCSTGRKMPGREHEHEHPQRVQRAVVGLAQTSEREDLEQVGGDARDDEAHADGERAVGQRERGDERLRPLTGRQLRGVAVGIARHVASALREGSLRGPRSGPAPTRQRRSGAVSDPASAPDQSWLDAPAGLPGTCRMAIGAQGTRRL